MGEKHSIVIKQEFLGRENDAIKVNIFVRGTLPQLESGATVSFTDFEEKYTREEPGFLRAYADRHVLVKQGEQEVQHRLTVDQVSFVRILIKSFKILQYFLSNMF